MHVEVHDPEDKLLMSRVKEFNCQFEFVLSFVFLTVKLFMIMILLLFVYNPLTITSIF